MERRRALICPLPQRRRGETADASLRAAQRPSGLPTPPGCGLSSRSPWPPSANDCHKFPRSQAVVRGDNDVGNSHLCSRGRPKRNLRLVLGKGTVRIFVREAEIPFSVSGDALTCLGTIRGSNARPDPVAPAVAPGRPRTAPSSANCRCGRCPGPAPPDRLTPSRGARSSPPQGRPAARCG